MCNEITEKQHRWEDRIIGKCNETVHRSIDPNICAGCSQCQSNYGMTKEELRQGVENNSVIDQGSFSWYECDVCGSALGGDRYVAHGVLRLDKHTERTIIEHYDICEDCLNYLANGMIPELED